MFTTGYTVPVHMGNYTTSSSKPYSCRCIQVLMNLPCLWLGIQRDVSIHIYYNIYIYMYIVLYIKIDIFIGYKGAHNRMYIYIMKYAIGYIIINYPIKPSNMGYILLIHSKSQIKTYRDISPIVVLDKYIYDGNI